MRKIFAMILNRALRVINNLEITLIGRGGTSRPYMYSISDMWIYDDTMSIYNQMNEHKFKINYDIRTISSKYFIVQKLFQQLKSYKDIVPLVESEMDKYKNRMIEIVNSIIRTEMRVLRI